MGQCLLIDGNNIAFRAYYAFDRQNLRTRGGKPTGALFGFTKMLFKVLKDRKPDFVAVGFDVARETFRHKMYPEYKAHRRPTPPDLLQQLPLTRELVAAAGIKVMAVPEFEADDLIGSAARFFEREHEVTILTGDRDLLQLIGPRVRVEFCTKGITDLRLIDEAEFRKDYGFPPSGIIDLKALMGDASDNIPGVDGIGEKKALGLVREFGTIDRLYETVETIPNEKLRAMVKAGRESAILSRTLATIDTKVECVDAPESFRWREENLTRPELVRLLREYEFFTLVPKEAAPLEAPGTERPSGETGRASLPPEGDSHSTAAAPAYAPARDLPGDRLLLTDPEELRSFFSKAGQVISLDIETDGLSPHKNRIIGVSLAADLEKAFYIPLRHAYLGLAPGDQMDPAIFFPVLNEGIRGKTLLGHNLKFDLEFLEREGVRHSGAIQDTMLASYVLDPTTSNALKVLAKEFMNVNVKEYTEVAAGRPFAEVPISDAAFYACQDVLLPLHLMPIFRNKLGKSDLSKLLDEIELPILPLLLEMEEIGIGLNRNYLDHLGRELDHRLKDLEATIHGHAGYIFNVNSSKQLQEVLFGKLQLTPPKKTKTGFSTDNEVLEDLSREHPICRDLIAFREIAKLKSTYVESLSNLVDPDSGLIHTSFNQTVTATGRLSSSNPNLQNIPIKTELGRKVRRAFIPPRPDELFLSLDYSQIELRLLAHFSQDEALIEAYRKNLDIHSITASNIFGKPVGEVTADERKVGKTINFGIIYGMSAFSLADDLGIPRGEAQSYIDRFFAGFPKVNPFFAGVLDEARKTGRVTTLFGRVRPLPELASKNRPTKAFGERVARNTPLQGSAADLVKKAMLDCDRALKEGGFRSRLVLQIHDELVFTCPREEIPRVGPLIKRTMEETVALRIPLVCDAATGTNLADLEDTDFGQEPR